MQLATDKDFKYRTWCHFRSTNRRMHTDTTNSHIQTPRTATDAQSADHEFDLLQELSAAAERQPRQRDLAQALGMSLGMTNSILKRLANKGLVSLKKLDGRTIQYVVTPAGTRELARRSYRYMRRTIGNVVRWKDVIDDTVMQARSQGHAGILLAGSSDLAFMVEHSCQRHGLDYRHMGNPDSLKPGCHGMVIAAESIDPDGSQAKELNSRLGDQLVFLRAVL